MAVALGRTRKKACAKATSTVIVDRPVPRNSKVTGRKHNRAVQTRRRALSRITPVPITREAFIDACRDAGMLSDADETLGPNAGGDRQHSAV
ncbi:DUF982 domain-containing protein [Ensifer sp. T173]|uniref:DUF982 domain-containing protein n=1 Tax=Ensifer canadensis TaxID=555315 RepID=A0AAW4FNA1_9HYPH|nr:DUF982 domain-containing protein [Ensifer canadensis]NOV19962.1 DUF982 domain-containing protein [Ensifer canadensis]